MHSKRILKILPLITIQSSPAFVSILPFLSSANEHSAVHWVPRFKTEAYV